MLCFLNSSLLTRLQQILSTLKFLHVLFLRQWRLPRQAKTALRQGAPYCQAGFYVTITTRVRMPQCYHLTIPLPTKLRQYLLEFLPSMRRL